MYMGFSPGGIINYIAYVPPSLKLRLSWAMRGAGESRIFAAEYSNKTAEVILSLISGGACVNDTQKFIQVRMQRVPSVRIKNP